jgi:hypothetical protein
VVEEAGAVRGTFRNVPNAGRNYLHEPRLLHHLRWSPSSARAEEDFGLYSRVYSAGTSGFGPALPHRMISLPHGSRKAWL